MKVKRITALILSLLVLQAASAVTFRFSAGTIDAGTLRNTMESNISKLLTEINRAGNANTALNLSAIPMEPEARKRLTALWSDSHFVCDRLEYRSNCLHDHQGYQVRAIAITMRPADNTYRQSLKRELTISLNRKGVITGVRPAWQTQEDVTTILGKSNDVTEKAQRYEILKWLEDFRCYYNERNLNALNQIYSDDALIITGSVVTVRHTTADRGVKIENKVKYTIQSKTEYIKKLAAMFNDPNTKRINVEFTDISVMRNGAKPNIYGVTLRQRWEKQKHRGADYVDDGWLFLLWDFTDPEHPQIIVRTWQEAQAAARDGVFDMHDFLIP